MFYRTIGTPKASEEVTSLQTVHTQDQDGFPGTYAPRLSIHWVSTRDIDTFRLPYLKRCYNTFRAQIKLRPIRLNTEDHIRIYTDSNFLTMIFEDETLYARYSIGEDGILIAVYHGEPMVINLEIAKKIVSDRKALGLGSEKKRLLLVRNDAGFTFDKPARDYLSSPEGAEGITAAAILIRSPIDLATVRFISIFGKPPIPMCYFRDERRAIVWLKKHENGDGNGRRATRQYP